MTRRSGVWLTALLPVVAGMGLGCPGSEPPPTPPVPAEGGSTPMVDQPAPRAPASRDRQALVQAPAPAKSVTGRVTSRADGSPVVGAVVEVRRRAPVVSAGRLRGRGKTDEDGRYQLLLSPEEPPGADLFLRISGPGLPGHVQPIDDGDVESDVVIDLRLVPLVGRVLGDAESGVSDARIVVWSVEQSDSIGQMLVSPTFPPVLAEAVSGEDGGFEVASLCPGWYVVEANGSVDGVVSVCRAVIVHAEGTPSLDLRLRPAASIGGQVVLEDGALSPGADVRVQVAGRWAVTDADGRFLLESLPAGLLLPVEVFKPAAAEAAVSFSLALDAGERRRLHIPIVPPRPDKRRRVVISMSGRSVPEGPADASLVLKLVAPDQSPLVGREVRLRRQGSRDPVNVRSGRGGLVVWPSAQQSRWDVWLQPVSSLGIGLLLAHALAPAADDAPVAVAVPGFCDVIGRALGNAKQAVAGARVSIGFRLPGRRGATLVRSDSRGVFVVEGIPAGQLTIRLASAGIPAVQGPTVNAGQRHQHVLSVPTSSAVFRGTVVSMGARSSPRAGVRIEAVDGVTSRLLGAVVSGADGRFVLALGQVGAADVEVASVVAGWRRQSRILKASHAEPLELRVGFPASLVVACLDEDGRPRSLPMEVSVSFAGEEAPRSFEGVTDALGLLRLVGIPPGKAALQVAVPGAVTHTFRDVEFREGEATAVQLTLVAASVLQLHVLGENGRPLLGAKVTVSHQNAISWQGRVGTDGQVVVGALPAGSFHVAITAPGHADWRETVALAKGQELARQVVLKEVFGVDGAVVTVESGAPVAGARCTFLIPGPSLTTTSGPDGRFSFDALPTGTWRLRVEADGYQAAEVLVGRPVPGMADRVSVEVKLEPQD